MAKTYIDQAAAKRLIADIQLGETPKDKPRTVYQSGIYEGLNMAYGAIASMRPADVRPVVVAHWYWDENGMDWGLGAWKCSNCRTKPETWWEADENNNPYRCSGGHYCGNCGADMRPGKEETDGTV